MDKKNKKKIRNYIIYSVIVAMIFGFVSPIISRYISPNEFFDWQTFIFWILSMVFVIVLLLYFPKFKKSGDV